MLRNLRFFFKDPFIRYPAAAAAIFIVAQVLVLVRGVKFRGEPIYLHYTTYLGVDFVGAPALAYLFPFAGLVAGLLNFGLAYRLTRQEKLLGYFLSLGTAIVCALFLLQVVSIVQRNS